MKALSTQEYDLLVDLADRTEPAFSYDDTDPVDDSEKRLLVDLRLVGMVRRSPLGDDDWLWEITDAGHRAIRAHRAYLGATSC